MPPRQQVHFWVSPKEHRMLRDLAQARDLTLAALLRQLIREADYRHVAVDARVQLPSQGSSAVRRQEDREDESRQVGSKAPSQILGTKPIDRQHSSRNDVPH